MKMNFAISRPGLRLLCSMLPFFGFGQNLIPNPGFEDVFTQLEYQWVQPQGAYYHCEHTSEHGSFPAHGGEFINGICMYNFEPNEYLHVKLLEPLEAGKKYRFEVAAHLLPAKAFGSAIQNYIGVYFGTTPISTHIPGDLFLEPQLRLALPEGDRLHWFNLVDTLTPVGGETYMTIGYFPAIQSHEHKEKLQADYMIELERRYAESKEPPKSDMAWLYLPPDEQKKYLKEQKGKKKQKEVMAKPRAEEQEFEPVRSENISKEFKSRYYFDDFCLAEIPGDGGEVICIPETPPERIEVGATINLRNVFFDTGEATIKEESEIQLAGLYQLFERYPDLSIRISGYTDNVGLETDNLVLSRSRAEAVRNWLLGKGVASDKLEFEGFGESNPIERNDTEAGRARNRRVVFTIIKL